MNIYDARTVGERVAGNSYMGRGIVAGTSRSGGSAVAAYFIMGRSANSRNRVFAKRGGELYTEPYDPAACSDPSLIIYAAVRESGNRLIVTNGDQTDTIYDGLAAGKSFSEALVSREFEPDAPNLTPRISAMLTFADGGVSYEMSILKSVDAEGSGCCRYTFSYPSKAGLGHFIHTYMGDGQPLPTFQGEPERVTLPDDIDELADDIWRSLDADNKISLYVRYTSLEDGSVTERIINKYGSDAK
ncbi:MAG: IMP cyclohydrolase [Oscillospiraceae bacterium]|nr:IMP cyclohydrolase [Oscillospiraceae bacterium]